MNQTSNTIEPAEGYAGNISAELAWQWVQGGEAVLVDVRTDAEREWVGKVPGAVPVAWKQWPGMAMNADFDAQLRAAVPQDQKVASIAMLIQKSPVAACAAVCPATFCIQGPAHRVCMATMPP